MQEFLNRVIHGNSAEIMAFMPSEYVDLTVTSPPYDNLRKYKGYSFPFEDIAEQLYRVTKVGGVVVWVVGDATVKGSETGTSFRQALYFKEIGFNLHDTMIYRKKNPMPITQNRYQPCFEYMFVLSKGKPKTLNKIMVDSKRKGEKNRLNQRNADGTLSDGHGKGKPVNDKKPKDNIWEYGVGYGVSTTDKDAFKHPAMFPEKLAEDHILSWSKSGDIVLDPMCGSGTTLKMAFKHNRNFIGIDYSEEYVDISKKRLESYNA